MKTPISWIIDDPAPVISVYHEHANSPLTGDGRPLVATYPNSMLFAFCDLVEKYGVKGKFSVVPMPGNKGDIVNGLEGVPKGEVEQWLECVKARLMPAFSIGPEMLTHHLAVDLATGKALSQNERDWSYTQNRDTLTPYITHALSLLQAVGIRSVGVTSPWDFGSRVEEEYHAAISASVQAVSGSDKAWLFLRSLRNTPNAKPWIAAEEDGNVLVAIPSTTTDYLWATIESPRTDEAFIGELADKMITEDGTDGEIIRVLDSGGYPILINHWQCLMSNGLGTGLRVMEVVFSRVRKHLSHRVTWRSFEEIMDLVLSQKEAYPKPSFT